MRQSGIVIVILLAVVQSMCAQTLSTTVAFEERVHNFGTIQEKKGKVSHEFVFQNKGTKPVAITDIYSGCGCIGKIISKGNIQPGAKGKVTITFNPEYLSGFFSKEIVVYSNDNKDYSRIWVEGTIVPAEHPVEEDYPYNFGGGLYLRLEVMAFGYIKPGETKQMELHYANNSDKEMGLNFAINGNNKDLKFTNPGKISSKAKGVVHFFYTMPFPGNKDVSLQLYPYVNKKKLTKPIEVKILTDNKLNQQALFK